MGWEGGGGGVGELLLRTLECVSDLFCWRVSWGQCWVYRLFFIFCSVSLIVQLIMLYSTSPFFYSSKIFFIHIVPVCHLLLHEMDLPLTFSIFKIYPKMNILQGYQVWLQNGSPWPQMEQIRNFFRSDFSTFWYILSSTNAVKCFVVDLSLFNFMQLLLKFW